MTNDDKNELDEFLAHLKNQGRARPENDLWPGIENQIKSGSVRQLTPKQWLAIAAAVILLVTNTAAFIYQSSRAQEAVASETQLLIKDYQLYK